MEERAIAPWRLDNPMPIWMRLTDPRNAQAHSITLKKNHKYACIEPNGHIEYFSEYLEVCQHYAISTGTLSRGIHAGSLTLNKKVYRFQDITKEKRNVR